MIQRLKDWYTASKQDRAARVRNAELVRSLDRGEVSHFTMNPDPRVKWYGNSYGGFFAVPPKNGRQAVVYSVGIGQDISFDRALNRAWGCRIHGFDPTPKSKRWFERQSNAAFMDFYPVGLGTYTGTATFHLPESDKATSGSLKADVQASLTRPIEVQLSTLSDLMARFGHTRLDILKVDIEGAEYDVLPALLADGIDIDQILIEFHDRWVAGTPSKAVHEALTHHGYDLVAHSAHYEEFTYLKRRP
jgi:FkbM family methyltransferase